MNGRHVAAQGRVRNFVKHWKAIRPDRDVIMQAHGYAFEDPADLLLVDLETLMKPRVVVRTIPQLQALAVGAIIVVQGDRAAQVEGYEDWDLETGAGIEAKRLLYVGTDLTDDLTGPSMLARDTLRRMLPAIVIHPLD
jgi:hypothetical protein